MGTAQWCSGLWEVLLACLARGLGSLCCPLPRHNVAQKILSGYLSCLLNHMTHVFSTNFGMGIWDPATLLPLCLLLKPGRIDPSTWKSPELSKDAVTIPYLCPIQQGFVRTYTELPEWEKTSMRKERIETKMKRLIQQKYYLATVVAFPM